jgi:pyruvate kinase
MFRRTKVICTIGPASRNEDVLSKISDYVDVFRVNFSHGTHSDHEEEIKRIRNISLRRKKYIAIMQDLPGPKLRVGKIACEPVLLKRGQRFTFLYSDSQVEGLSASVNYPNLLKNMKTGDILYLADGLIKMKVRDTRAEGVECVVLEGGYLSSGKGISFKRKNIQMEYLTEENENNLRFGIENRVNFIALSFVRSGKDVERVREITGNSFSLVAKIETREAVKNLKEIILSCDGVMVARGDLGVELSMESVPEIQSRIIIESLRHGKFSIVATQMLESMVTNPIPTRAEVTDISTAVKDGADALMLSDETAVGKYPVKAAMVLCKIASYAEKRVSERTNLNMGKLNVEEAVSRAACVLADYVDASAIVTPTQTGTTARRVSIFRPKRTIVAMCTDEGVLRKLSLVWGVYPVKVKNVNSTDKLFEEAVRVCTSLKLAERNDFIVVTSGTPGIKGSTNMLKIIKVD